MARVIRLATRGHDVPTVDGGPPVRGRDEALAAAADGRIRRRRPNRPALGWEALTLTERRVAELTAEGYTNAQIAVALGIAVATVKAHLRQVFRKLAVDTRASVASRLYPPSPMPK